MNPLRTILRRFRSLGQRSAIKREIDEELRFHLERRTAENIADGMSAEDAAREAGKRFGNMQTVREQCREANGANFAETVMQDIRFGLRMLRKHPGFTILAVLSLAIGVGVNTTIFSALDAAFLRPLPIKNSSELVRFESPLFTFAEYQEMQANMRSLSNLVAVAHHGSMLRGNDGMTMCLADYVSPNYFTALGVKPAAGSLFSEGDSRLGEGSTVVISYGLWQRHFAGDPKIVGQTIPLVPRPATVLGVAAKGFGGVDLFPSRDLWFAHTGPSDGLRPQDRDFQFFGRLRAGYSAPQVHDEAEAEAAQLGGDLARGEPGKRVLVWSEKEHEGDHGGNLVFFVMPIVGLVLLVACANVSSFLLARYEDRRRELAVRMALGGGRRRLLRQLLVEGLLLSVLGSLVGLLLTFWAVHLVPALLPAQIAGFAPELRVDRRVFGLAMALACLSTLLFALWPAWRATRVDLGPLLKGEFVLASSPVRWWSGRYALVVAQLAVSLVFLAATTLLVRGFFRGMGSDFGFDPKNVLVVMFGGSSNGQSYYDRLQERMRALPGVRAVSLATRVPFALSGGGLAIKVLPPQPNAEVADISCSSIEPSYFDTMGIRLQRGRDFDWRDNETGPRVVIVSEAAAKRFWPNEDPVGKSIQAGFEKLVPRQIVGVARDASNSQVGESPPPFLYLPLPQEPRGDIRLLVRTDGHLAGMTQAVRRALQEVDKDSVVMDTSTLEGTIHVALMAQWVGACLGGVLGLLAFLLGVCGLYGVVSYAVSRRTRELGIRMALGAGRGDVLWMVLRQGLTLALVGVAVGLPVAIAVGFLMRGLLFGIGPEDFVSMAGSSALVAAVALLASYIPARRAAKINPMEALRYE
jgi:predicted permease